MYESSFMCSTAKESRHTIIIIGSVPLATTAPITVVMDGWRSFERSDISAMNSLFIWLWSFRVLVVPLFIPNDPSDRIEVAKDDFRQQCNEDRPFVLTSSVLRNDLDPSSSVSSPNANSSLENNSSISTACSLELFVTTEIRLGFLGGFGAGGSTLFTATGVPRKSALITIPNVPRPNTIGFSSGKIFK